MLRSLRSLRMAIAACLNEPKGQLGITFCQLKLQLKTLPETTELKTDNWQLITADLGGRFTPPKCFG